MLGFIKKCVDEYNQYKADRAEDSLLVEKAMKQRDIEIAEDNQFDEKLLLESISYNKEDDTYHFEVTKYHNGSPRVFSCDENTKEECASVAKWIMLQAHIYEASGC